MYGEAVRSSLETPTALGSSPTLNAGGLQTSFKFLDSVFKFQMCSFKASC